MNNSCHICTNRQTFNESQLKLKPIFFLPVYANYLGVQLTSCLMLSEHEMTLFTWTHFCVRVAENVTMYVNGSIVDSFPECSFKNITKITSGEGSIVLGANPVSGEQVSAILADVRYFPISLDKASISDVYKFNYTKNSISLLAALPQTEITTVKKAYLITRTAPDKWFFLPEKYNYTLSFEVCDSFGGDIINARNENEEALSSFVSQFSDSIVTMFWTKIPGTQCEVVEILREKLYFRSFSCDSSSGTLCAIEDSVSYYIIGLDNVDRLAVEFTPDEYRFDAEFDYSVIYDRSKLTLNVMRGSFEEEAIFSSARYVLASELIGRRSFTDVGTNKIRRITITKCNVTEFTCSDGECVPLDKLCNIDKDCEDYTDEQFCNVTEKRPSFYDNTLSGSRPLRVNVSVTLLRILELSISDGKLQIELQIEAYWKDSRVEFHNLRTGIEVEIPPNDIVYYWQPNIVLSDVIYVDHLALSMAKNPGEMFVTATEEGYHSTFLSQAGKSNHALLFSINKIY